MNLPLLSKACPSPRKSHDPCPSIQSTGSPGGGGQSLSRPAQRLFSVDPGQARSFLAHILNDEARSRESEILLALIPRSSHSQGPSLCFLSKPCLATRTTPIPTPTGIVLEDVL